MKTLDQIYVEDFVPDHPNGMADDTVRMGLTALNHLAEFLGYPPTLADLTDDTLRRYMDYRLNVKHRQATTVNGETRPIKALWNWAWKNRMVENRPQVPKFPIPRPATEAEPWRFDEMQALLDECRQARGNLGPVKASLYWPAFNYAQWDLEERPKVMIALRWADVNWDSGRMLMPTEVRGHGRKSRSMYLSPETRRALRAIEKPKRKLIFGDGVTVVEFRILFKQLMLASKLSWQKYDASPMSMYRAFATFRQAAVAVGRVPA